METKGLRVFLIALSLLAVVAVDSMWGMILRNGYYKELTHLRDHGPYVLPGSNTPIKRTYTGIYLVDFWLTVMQYVLANVTDGSAPHLSLFAFHSSGQLLAVTSVVMIEGMRQGNKGSILSVFVAWGLAMTGIGYAVITPIYCIIHLLVSPTTTSDETLLSRSIKTSDLSGLSALPSSVTIGLHPSGHLDVPPFFSSSAHQSFVASWHLFPIWVELLQLILVLYRFFQHVCAPTRPERKQHIASNSSELTILRRGYIFAFAAAATTHIITLTILASTALLPSLFTPLTLQSISFRNVFVPPSYRSHVPTKVMVQGCVNILQYDQYVGSTAAIVWAVGLFYTLHGRSVKKQQWLQLAFEIMGVSIVAGPGAAVVVLMWRRDERLLREVGKRGSD